MEIKFYFWLFYSIALDCLSGICQMKKGVRLQIDLAEDKDGNQATLMPSDQLQQATTGGKLILVAFSLHILQFVSLNWNNFFRV